MDALRGYVDTPSGTPSTHAHPGKGQITLGRRWFWRKSRDTRGGIECVSVRGKRSGMRGEGITKMIAPVLKGGYFMGYSAFGFEGGGVGVE